MANRYVYAYFVEADGRNVHIYFPKFPEIISEVALRTKHFDKSAISDDVQKHACEALIAGLQGRIATRLDIPEPDDLTIKAADGFVILTVQQSMKLELFKLYRENCRSVVELARRINKQETAARRLLNLRHPSHPLEVEAAFEVLGKQIVHFWGTEPATVSSISARAAINSPRLE